MNHTRTDTDERPDMTTSSTALDGTEPWQNEDFGTRIGVHADTGQHVHYDPRSAFEAQAARNPDLYILGQPGIGKTTTAQSLINGAVAQGQIPVIAADLAGDYSSLIAATGGTVTQLGLDGGTLDPLALGGLESISTVLDDFPHIQREVAEHVLVRRRQLVVSICEILRGTPLSDHEIAVISTAVRQLDRERTAGDHRSPSVRDVYTVIETESPDLTTLLTSMAPLVDTASIIATVFSATADSPHYAATDNPAQPALSLDLSTLDIRDSRERSVLMLAATEAAFGAAHAANVLADVGLRPHRKFLLVLDEMDLLLAAGPAARRHLEELTHHNDGSVIATMMIGHRVAGSAPFIERAGALLVGALSRSEVEALDAAVPLPEQDRAAIAFWALPGVRPDRPRPGLGMFLLRVGGHDGAGVQLVTNRPHQHHLHSIHSLDLMTASPAETAAALGGQVIALGRSSNTTLNPLLPPATPAPLPHAELPESE